MAKFGEIYLGTSCAHIRSLMVTIVQQATLSGHTAKNPIIVF